ncbi:hypothetical protein, partial [Lacticaseibacillus pantheris]|uniref:hypothetical protein n=1 Tax=Lacticaseibacillus pantheris TaxID=171523 RepID=UPI001CDB02E2
VPHESRNSPARPTLSSTSFLVADNQSCYTFINKIGDEKKGYQPSRQRIRDRVSRNVWADNWRF